MKPPTCFEVAMNGTGSDTKSALSSEARIVAEPTESRRKEMPKTRWKPHLEC